MAESSPSPSPFSTPKRKRSDIAIDNVPSPSYTHFSFEVDAPATPASGGGGSPRSRVAHRFRGLALNDSGGGVVAADAHRPQFGPAATHDRDPAETMEIDEDESKMRKRTRLSPCPPPTAATPNPQEANDKELPETPAVQNKASTAAAPQPYHEHRFAPIDDSARSNPEAVAAVHVAIDPPLVARSPVASPAGLHKAQASLSNRPVEALRQKTRKRAGTPPLTAQRSNKAGSNVPSSDAASEVIDPIRAALTWHDDEITVYDPDDEDDDGVGINGIGFKPTPAIAYARTMKKRQQLAEYKKREEREARARRSHRRRGSPERPAPKLERKESARKVRFTEAEPSMMIETI